jgi:phage/plasmid-associated DNA primase
MSEVKIELDKKRIRVKSLLTSESKISVDAFKEIYFIKKIDGKKDISDLIMRKLRIRIEPEISDEEFNNAISEAHTDISDYRTLIAAERTRIAQSAMGDKYPDRLYKTSTTESEGTITTDIDHKEVAKFVSNELHTVAFKSMVYICDEAMMYRMDVNDVSKVVVDIMHDRGLNQNETTTVNNILLILKGINKFERYPFDLADGVVVLENCAIRIGAGVVEKISVSHELMKTVRMPVKYDETADTSIVLKVFGEWVTPEDFPILIQAFSHSIFQYMKRVTFKRGLLAIGKRDSGKSTFMDLLRMFFGLENTGSVSLEAIATRERFTNCQMEGKLANVKDEISNITMNCSTQFKDITGDINHLMEYKNKDAYIGIITCPPIYSCNLPPRVSKDVYDDDAWWNRWILLQFPFHHKMDTTFASRTFTKEFMSGLLNVVLKDLIRIETTGKLIIPREWHETRDIWMLTADPLKQWVDKMFELDRNSIENYTYGKEELYSAYCEFVEKSKFSEDLKINTLQEFCKELNNYGFESATTRNPLAEKYTTMKIKVLRSNLRWIDPKVNVEPSYLLI